MCDQLRYDYLGCTGHPSIRTPNIDGLAARGVNFSRAYIQTPLCGPSRASYYTGRYMFCHGSTWNGHPIRPDELTMGDYLRPLGERGVRVALVGKIHMATDYPGLERLGADLSKASGKYIEQCGFEPYVRDDGLHPDQIVSADLAYNEYLREQGYEGDNPWNSVANAASGEDGETLSGWHMRNSDKPAVVADEHSETAYMTDRAMDFMEDAGDDAWCLHLSYIKPHWPYIVSAPYHDMYNSSDLTPVQRGNFERERPHPVHEAFMAASCSETFARDEVRERVLPAYMGLITQIDDHLGRLFAHMKDAGRMEDTMIVFTSDHGDYLGDHWLGEKDTHFDPSIRVPMIVYDPSTEADATRGTVDDRLVESIDLIPTFYKALGGGTIPFRLEGRSLLPLIRGEEDVVWRDTAFCEMDYSQRDQVLRYLKIPPSQCRGFIAITDQWKYVIYEGFAPQLYNLKDDPQELNDLHTDPAYSFTKADLHEKIFKWLRQRHTRIMDNDEDILAIPELNDEAHGIFIGYW